MILTRWLLPNRLRPFDQWAMKSLPMLRQPTAPAVALEIREDVS